MHLAKKSHIYRQTRLAPHPVYGSGVNLISRDQDERLVHARLAVEGHVVDDITGHTMALFQRNHYVADLLDAFVELYFAFILADLVGVRQVRDGKHLVIKTNIGRPSVCQEVSELDIVQTAVFEAHATNGPPQARVIDEDAGTFDFAYFTKHPLYAIVLSNHGDFSQPSTYNDFFKETLAMNSKETPMKELCDKIHATPTKAVLVVAGGGSQVIGELLRYGGGSNTILDAQVPYSQTAFEEFIGGVPDKFVSADAACSLAMGAYLRARKLTPPGTDIVGIGATASLVKDGERIGREHKLFVASQTCDETTCHEYVYPGGQTREEEEERAARIILAVLSAACHIEFGVIPYCTHAHKSPGDAARVVSGEKRLVNLTTPAGELPEKKVVFPGSFNPIHDGHLKCAEIAARITGQPVDFEISFINVDKPFSHFRSINARLDDFQKHKSKYDFLGDLYLSDTPKFIEKARILPGCTFVVGFDTFSRISDYKYYKNHARFNEILDELVYGNVRWIVFPRLMPDGHVSTPDDVRKLPLYNSLVTTITREEYDPLEVAHLSSREIRKKS